MFKENETYQISKHINEVSKNFKIKKSTLRFWEEHDLLHPLRNTENGYREYNRAAITELEDLISYKAMDLPIKDIKKLMNSNVTEEIALYTVMRKKLCDKIDKLNDSLKYIDYKESRIKKYLKLKNRNDYKFNMPDGKAIIKWDRNWDCNTFEFLSDSYIAISFNPKNSTHYSDGYFTHDENNPEYEYLWKSSENANPWIEFLLETEYGNPANNNLNYHLEKLHNQGYKTGAVLSRFLTTDLSDIDNIKHDYFCAWVEIIPL